MTKRSRLSSSSVYSPHRRLRLPSSSTSPPQIASPETAALRRRRRRQLPPTTKKSQIRSSSASSSAPASIDDNMVIRIERVVHRDCRAEPEPGSIPEPLRQHLLAISASSRKKPSKGPRRPSIRRYSLSPNTTVGALKAMLRLRHQLGRDFILLHPHKDTYPRSLSDENRSLREYGVKDCGTLRMTSPHKFPLRVATDHPVVQPPSTTNSRDGHFILVYPSIYDTVATLKELIFEETGYPPHTQLLDPHSFKFQNRDDHTLESLGFNCSGEWQQIALVHTPAHPRLSTVLDEVY